MPIPIIIGASLVAAGTVGASAIAARQQKKAADRAEELAKEQQQTAIAEQRRLEEKFGLTPGELSREQRLLGIPEGEKAVKFDEQGLEAKRQKELERKAGLTGEELLGETGPETRALLDQISKRRGMTGEELFKAEGEIPRLLTEEISKPGPTAMFEPELELVRQMVNAEANRRGVFGGLPEGGIRFEQLGRAGVDLAIKSASERLAQRSSLSNIMANLSAGARGEAGTVAERALSSSERSRVELAQFLQDMQQQSAASKGRAAQAGIRAANIAQPSIAQSYQNLQDIEGVRGGIVSPTEAGLSALGQIGATQLGKEDIFKSKKKEELSSLSELRKAGSEYDFETELGDITGAAGLKKKKSDLPKWWF